jgi:hypothetical protein
MKTLLILSVASLATISAGWLALYIIRRIQNSKMLRKIAAEGFETATDILYPKKRRVFRKHKVGPVLPH